MAESEQDLQHFEFSIPYADADSDLEMINQFTETNASMMGNFNTTDFAVDNFLGYQLPEYHAVFAHTLPGTSQSNCLNKLPILRTITSTRHVVRESNKRKSMELPTSSSESSPSTASRELKDNNTSARKNSLAKGKKRDNDKEQDKQEGVMHVRAKRGQATDNHSLAERVRRQKINYKLRCLQGLVPGCHKTMGMAMMLDEIINYVHSLKNQVEFLSTELAAACSSYATERAKGTNSQKARAMEISEREQDGEQTRFHTTWPV